VLLCDATATAGFALGAWSTRARASGPVFAAVAAVAAMSLAPGVVAVGREERAHRPGTADAHRLAGSVLLFGAGQVIATAGTTAILVASPRISRAATIADVVLLVGGNGIGLPYLAIVRALHG
jgi:hypothetical protein